MSVDRKLLLWAGLIVLACGAADAAESAVQEGAVAGYADDATFERQVAEIGRSPHAAVRSLDRTLGGRPIWLITIAGDPPPEVMAEGQPPDVVAASGDEGAEAKPALLILGSVHGPHLLGSELAVRLARRLASDDEAAVRLRQRLAFYIVPRPSPDASAAYFTRPYEQRAVNTRPIDDDNDGRIDEDGPDDLNGDGWITMMRVEDAAGRYMPHPDEPRILIEADAAKGQRGRYKLYAEGRDDDGDERFNEDGAGGVDFNRNFTFDYPYFKPGAGPHQVSEPETRAVADFAFDQVNIAAVFSFGPHDNLMTPWRSGQSERQGRIRTELLRDDKPYFDRLAEMYREIHGGENPPRSPEAPGSLVKWAYFHYGRWSFAARAWWPPRARSARDVEEKQAEDGAEEQMRDDDSDETAEPQRPVEADADPPEAGSRENAEEPNPPDESEPDEFVRVRGRTEREPAGRSSPAQRGRGRADAPGAEQVRALRWLQQQGIDGFVDWAEIEHPDFPDRRVEVGGLRPFVTLNPPADRLDELADRHFRFLVELGERMPRLQIERVKAEPLGGGVVRMTVTVVNVGYLPTMPKMGEVNGAPYPLRVELRADGDIEFIRGRQRVQIGPLAGSGGHGQQEWLIRTEAKELTVRVHGPSVGSATKTVELP